jgi:hypothetical protein
MTWSMPLGLLFVLALFFASRYLLRRYTERPRLANVVAASLVVSYLLGAASYELIAGRHADAPATSATSPLPDLAVPTTPAARRNAGALQRLQALPAPPALGSIDIFSTSSDGSVTVTGWAADPVTKSRGAGLMFIIDDRVRVDATPWYGTDRSDVANAYGSGAMERTGFLRAPLPRAGLAAGSHRLALGVLAPDGLRFYLLPANKEFQVR